jgi:hypothetical protein
MFETIFERGKQGLLFIIVLDIEDNIRPIMSIAWPCAEVNEFALGL